MNGARPTRPASRRMGLWTAMLAAPLAITLILPSESGSPIVAAIDAGAFLWTVLGAPYFVAVLVFELHRVLTEHMEEAHPEPAAPGQRSHAPDQRASRSTPVEPPAASPQAAESRLSLRLQHRERDEQRGHDENCKREAAEERMVG